MSPKTNRKPESEIDRLPLLPTPPDDPQRALIDRKAWADQIRAVRRDMLETVAVMTALIEKLDPPPRGVPPPYVSPLMPDDRD